MYSILITLSVFVGVTVFSFFVTYLVRKLTLNVQLLDMPNNRSSHTLPVPRGGGLGFVLIIFGLLTIKYLRDEIAIQNFLSIIVAGGLVAGIGLLDDLRDVSARLRLFIHFLSASIALYVLGGIPSLQLAGDFILPVWFYSILASLYLVWLLNLYNFMDGIDGIAGVQAITTLLGGVVLYHSAHVPLNETRYILYICAAILGFLLWNFPKAKIFMGDVGSGFLGIMLGIFSIQAGWVDVNLFWGWIILLGVFITDTSVTLIVRLLNGEKFYKAHRNHAYQHAARQRNSHIIVTLTVAAINLFWLLPVSWGVVERMISVWMGLALAYIPLILMAILYRAGRPERVS